MPAGVLARRARDLSWTEARDVVFAMARQQVVQLDDSVADQFTATRNPDGTITVTPPAQPRANAGTSADGRGRFTLRPDIINGVEVRYIHGFTARHDIARSARRGALRALDPRFIVLLAWLCERLHNNWGATTLYDLGFLGDTAHSANNCHHWGRAFDFAGVGGQAGWGPYNITILKHWGMQPITMPVDWGPINPSTHQHRYRQGHEYPQWPDNFTDTTYRLEMPDDPQVFMDWLLRRAAHTELATAVFRDVYDFFAIEAKDTDDPNAAPTTIGRESRYIIHPDHRTTRLRTSHRNHIHVQLGPTEHSGFWAG
jgi:hypothetical protein